MLGIPNETSLFEFRLKQVAYGLLKIPDTRLMDMTPNEILDLWGAHVYEANHSTEADRTNRISLAIVAMGMGEEEEKKQLMQDLLIEDPVHRDNRIIEQIKSMKNIKGPEKVKING
jgi:hypothetical protein